jgi:hypothetical protein
MTRTIFCKPLEKIGSYLQFFTIFDLKEIVYGGKIENERLCKWSMGVLRMTGFEYASPSGGAVYERPQSDLHPLCGFSPPRFAIPANTTHSFIVPIRLDFTPLGRHG